MNKATYYVGISNVFDETGFNDFFIGYVYDEPMKEEADKIKGCPSGWLDVFAAKDEATLASRIHLAYEDFEILYSEGNLKGKIF